ncbi:MAG: type IX secretion system membrane protein PorP/SprF [bacterium]
MKFHFKIKLSIVFILLFEMSLANPGRAQNMISANPAELIDFKSVFVNPAILSFQNAHAAMGGKLFHLGFVENQLQTFRQGFVSLALPFGIDDFTGIGIQAQYFNTPLFSQSNISFAAARRFHRILSLGVKLNVFNKSFNRDNFNLVEADDPVFANGTTKWNATFGAGLSVIPYPFLRLGVGIDHINRANVSLINDNVYEPFKSYFGVVLTFGALRAAFSATHAEGQFHPETSIGSAFAHAGYFMLGFNDKAVQVEGQLRITGPLSINYRYDYTLFDGQSVGNGSHQITLIHEFDRKPALPEIKVPEEFLLRFEPPDKPLVEESKFYIYPSLDKLEIIHKKLTRFIDPNVNQGALSQLSAADIGVLDSTKTETYLPFVKDTVDQAILPDPQELSLSGNYRAFIEKISEDLKINKSLKTQIFTPGESMSRAVGLREFLQIDSTAAKQVAFLHTTYKSKQDSLRAAEKLGQRFIQPRESLLLLSHNSTTFSIIPVSQIHFAQSWRFIIENKRGEKVRIFQGIGMPPDQIVWDWKTAEGELVSPGTYHFYMIWQDNQQTQHTSEKYNLFVQKIIRNITIEVTNKPKPTGVDADEINIILKK